MYLAFHGKVGVITVGDGRKIESGVTLDQLEELLKGKCDGRMIHFSSCSTMNIHGRRLKRFLDVTCALSISGYKKQVDWMQSAAFELLVLTEMQYGPVTISSVGKMRDRINKGARGFVRELGFEMKVHAA